MNQVLGLEIAMKKEEMTRCNETRSSVVEEERRVEIIGQRQENRIFHSDR